MKTKSIRVSDWESHLIKRAAAGESVAFELLTDLHRPALLALATRMLRNREDAQDAVQETFLKAFKNIRDFDPERPLRPWLCRICANCCVDLVRLKKREGESLESHGFEVADPSEPLDQATHAELEGQRVREAVNRLPERYREIVIMRHFRHMDVLEIAVALGAPEGTVKSWLFRARSLLKADLRAA